MGKYIIALDYFAGIYHPRGLKRRHGLKPLTIIKSLIRKISFILYLNSKNGDLDFDFLKQYK
jgi:hypothetical protein